MTRHKAQRFCGKRCAAIATHPGPVPTRRVIPRDRELLHRLYVEEERGTPELAQRFGVAPLSVNRVLRELGIPIRKHRTARSLAQRALTLQQLGRLSNAERELLAALRTAGLSPVPQYAVGKFNIDLAFPEGKLAVEVDGGMWHEEHKKRRADIEREIALEAQGWRVLRFTDSRKGWLERAVRGIRRELRAR